MIKGSRELSVTTELVYKTVEKRRCIEEEHVEWENEKAHDLGITCCDFSSQPVPG